jgi:hypothetical protein
MNPRDELGGEEEENMIRSLALLEWVKLQERLLK